MFCSDRCVSFDAPLISDQGSRAYRCITQNGAVQPVSMPSGESVLCCIAGPRDLSHYGSWNCFSYRVSDCKVALQCYVILSSLHSLLLNFT